MNCGAGSRLWRSGPRRASFPSERQCSRYFTATLVRVGTASVDGVRNSVSCIARNGLRSTKPCCRLEPQQRAYLLLVEAYYYLAVYNGGRGRLGVHLDHLLHCIEVGADVLLDKINVPLR